MNDASLFTYDGSKVWDGNRYVENPLRAGDAFHDRNFYNRTTPVELCGMQLEPIHISGYWSEPYFEHWQGVDWSPAPFSMKAYRDIATGVIYHPGGEYSVDNNTGSQRTYGMCYLMPVSHPVPDHAISTAYPRSKYF